MIHPTAQIDPNMAQMLYNLKQRNRRVSLVAFGRQAPPPMPGVALYHRPFRR